MCQPTERTAHCSYSETSVLRATTSDTLTRRIRHFFSINEEPRGRDLWPLFLVSFSALYLEILLIRWIGTEIRLFAYFQNLTLIACFLGFGLGCYRAAARKSHLFEATAVGTLLILAMIPSKNWQALLETLSSGMAFSPDAAIWSDQPVFGTDQLTILFLFCAFVVAVLLLLIVASMIPLGQWVGHYLNSSNNAIAAYSVNLLGSLAGIWLFAGVSVLRLAPIYWFGFAFLLYFVVRNPARKLDLLAVVIIGVCLILLFHSAFLGPWNEWSPYQKLVIQPLSDDQYNIRVNNTGYMTVANLTPTYLAAHPDVARQYQTSSYDAPFYLVGKRDRVLIVGAGAGNDASAALRNGAREVDAIEIDPVIYSLGKRIHPDHPYESPRVHVVLEDARYYLRRCTSHYDAIVFGLLDSHTQFSGYSNMRIDNYVYTEESLAEAKRLLSPSGVLIVKFEVRAPWTWMGQRFYATFDKLFGRPPVVYYAPAIGGLLSATEFIASNDSGAWDRAAQPPIASFIQQNPPDFPVSPKGAPPPVTDDWPYVYHRNHFVPRTYLTVSVILLLIALISTGGRGSFQPGKSSTWTFFFLGAGFLLLETQLISRLALYFGSTWFVNCVALSAILTVLLLANLVVERVPGRSLLYPYFLLVVSLLAIHFVPFESLPFNTHVIGIVLAAAYCVPLFFAGVIFTETFRRFEHKSSAFGSNIIGAVAGGLAENLSFVFGLKALLLFAAVFYAFAGLFAFLRLRDTVDPASKIVTAGRTRPMQLQ
jgi:spermidine synthase